MGKVASFHYLIFYKLNKGSEKKLRHKGHAVDCLLRFLGHSVKPFKSCFLHPLWSLFHCTCNKTESGSNTKLNCFYPSLMLSHPFLLFRRTERDKEDIGIGIINLLYIRSVFFFCQSSEGRRDRTGNDQPG